jgi:hypothetical protein
MPEPLSIIAPQSSTNLASNIWITVDTQVAEKDGALGLVDTNGVLSSA